MRIITIFTSAFFAGLLKKNENRVETCEVNFGVFIKKTFEIILTVIFDSHVFSLFWLSLFMKHFPFHCLRI